MWQVAVCAVGVVSVLAGCATPVASSMSVPREATFQAALAPRSGLAVTEPFLRQVEDALSSAVAEDFTATVDVDRLPAFTVARAGGVWRVEQVTGSGRTVIVTDEDSSCSAQFPGSPSSTDEARALWQCGPVSSEAASAWAFVAGMTPSAVQAAWESSNMAGVGLQNMVTEPWRSADLVGTRPDGSVAERASYALADGAVDVVWWDGQSVRAMTVSPGTTWVPVPMAMSAGR